MNNGIQAWGEVFVGSMQDLWRGFIGLLPVLLGAIVVFLLGWVLAALFGKATARLLQMLQVDKASDELGIMKHLKKAGLEWEVSTLFGALVRWFFVVVAFLAAVELLGLQELSNFLREILLYLPNVLVAGLILLVAGVLANFVDKVVRASMKATEARPVELVSAIVRWSIWVFAFLAALSQLGIASALVEILFMGFVAMLAIAGGLAFGLGGQDAARDVLAYVRRNISEK